MPSRARPTRTRSAGSPRSAPATPTPSAQSSRPSPRLARRRRPSPRREVLLPRVLNLGSAFDNSFASKSSNSIAVDRQDDISGLPLRFDVPGRFNDTLERVAPVDDGPVPASLDELLEEDDVLLRVSRRYGEQDFLVTEARGPRRQHEIPEPVGREVAAAPLQ